MFVRYLTLAILFLVSSASFACETQNVEAIVSAPTYEDCSSKELRRAKEALLERLKDVDADIRNSPLPGLGFKRNLPLIGAIKSTLSMLDACGSRIVFGGGGTRFSLHDDDDDSVVPAWCPVPECRGFGCSDRDDL
jgi:hypothetical protein